MLRKLIPIFPLYIAFAIILTHSIVPHQHRDKDEITEHYHHADDHHHHEADHHDEEKEKSSGLMHGFENFMH